LGSARMVPQIRMTRIRPTFQIGKFNMAAKPLS
jgi:hypothetical protein